MPFTAQELLNISNSTLDWFMDRGEVHDQSTQDKPLLRDMDKNVETFPGGKGNLEVRVKFDVTSSGQGYSHNDNVRYQNPANTKKATYNWFEHHEGISVTMTELKHDGISVVDTDGKSTTGHSQREKTALANILKEKYWDLDEGWKRFRNNLCWRDGTADPKSHPGIKSVISRTPTAAALVGGLDQSLIPLWRNRAVLGISAASPASQTIAKILDTEYRQLRRYRSGRPPKHKFYAGSDFLDALLAELRANGIYTQSGWSAADGIDMAAADPKFKGMKFEYDPTMDDEGDAKFMYCVDHAAIKLKGMEGEMNKKHNPTRPAEQYVIYKAITWTGGLVCNRRTTSGVYSIA